jgi:hypothetical protein
MHIGIQLPDHGLGTNKWSDALEPSISGIVSIHVGDEEVGNRYSVLYGCQMTTKFG